MMYFVCKIRFDWSSLSLHEEWLNFFCAKTGSNRFWCEESVNFLCENDSVLFCSKVDPYWFSNKQRIRSKITWTKPYSDNNGQPTLYSDHEEQWHGRWWAGTIQTSRSTITLPHKMIHFALEMFLCAANQKRAVSGCKDLNTNLDPRKENCFTWALKWNCGLQYGSFDKQKMTPIFFAQ